MGEKKERKRIKRAFETFKLMDELAPEDWLEAGAELRRVARRIGVPYLMLLLDYYKRVTPRVGTLGDIEEWNAAPAARAVLTDAWASAVAPAKAVA